MSFKKRLLRDVYTRDISFGYFVPSGYAGVVTRLDSPALIEQQLFNASNVPSAFGLPVAVDANGIRPIGTSDTNVANVFQGFLVRPYPTSQNSATGAVGSGAPNPTWPGNVLKRGYMIVALGGSTAAVKNAQAYVRVANSGTGKPIGGVEATSETAITAALAGGDTGNGTCTSLSVGTNAIAGVYVAKFLTTTTIQVYDPLGRVVGPTASIVATTGQTAVFAAATYQIGFTITEGSATFAAGDSVNITVAFNTQAMPGVYFTGPADSTGLVEVSVGVNIH